MIGVIVAAIGSAAAVIAIPELHDVIFPRPTANDPPLAPVDSVEFVRKVMSGREFYEAGKWEKAAELWNEAAVSIPPVLAKGTIDEDKLARAKSAYARKQFEVSSDFFKEAFQKVNK